MLIDKFGRQITYARIAVTDRCNLRCFYCMPENAMHFLPRKDLLTYEEMERLSKILTDEGVTKIRITGGEPFVRRDLIHFLTNLRKNTKLNELHITTNGVLTEQYLDQLKSINISSINLSLDTLDEARFLEITRRDEFTNVMSTFNAILYHNIPLKVNMVAMKGKNEDDIVEMAELSLSHPISVRFIEEMPFNGSNEDHGLISYQEILDILSSKFGELSKIQDPENSTAYHYKIPGSKGNLGIIAAYTRSFCGTCNRIRITPEGIMKNCLYDGGGLNLRTLLRDGSGDRDIAAALQTAILNKHKDGHLAEANRDKSTFESMSSIGG
ncbi:GTP 3',8-cyclase MoaA [Fulvivirga sp.]|uniref:GTP 3',8-cyclase MoaA n=1 Tax=Fulvivirga sp. TaxID=1931237 RepID=UPI0032EC32B0